VIQVKIVYLIFIEYKTNVNIKIELHIFYIYIENQTTNMSSIQVLTDTLPKDGYKLICEYYNTHKPEDAMFIRKAGVYEGGFEIPLNKDELNILSQRYSNLDPNQMVRQLRWNMGWLLSFGYAGLHESEEKLLLDSLIHVLGKDKVVYKPYTNNETWWEEQLPRGR